VTSSWRWP